MSSVVARNGFDKLAGPYRWMEYVSFGPLLWRTRVAFLPQMRDAREALLLGDGDGRFAAALLRANRNVRVCAVDASGAMLERLRQRLAKQGSGPRVRTLQLDASGPLSGEIAPMPQGEDRQPGRFDLVCSHFFLDCLTDAECRAVAERVAGQMEDRGCWVVSEFAVPQGAMRWPARLLVRGLYAAFGLLTGLRVRRLPDYAGALRAAGLERVAVETRLFGILRSECWQLERGGGAMFASQSASKAV